MFALSHFFTCRYDMDFALSADFIIISRIIIFHVCFIYLLSFCRYIFNVITLCQNNFRNSFAWKNWFYLSYMANLLLLSKTYCYTTF